MNELKTIFIFDTDLGDRRIDSTQKKLFALNNDFNNLGKNADFGSKIFVETTKGADGLGKLGKEVDSLKTKAENAFKPTISRWTSEAEKATTAVKTLGREVDTLQSKTTGLNNAGADSLKRIGANPLNAPTPISKGVPNIGLSDDIEKAKLSAQKLNGQKLDAGKFDGLTQAGVRLHNELGKVSTDVARINSQLSKTTDKNLIAALNNDLAVADDKLSKLNGRLAQYTKTANAQSAAAGGGKRGGGGRGRITNLQATVLELTDDFAPEGFNKPYNAAARAMLGVNAVSLTTLATFGAIAAAGYGIVKVTQNIREEAEKRLKIENALTGAINKQIISQQEGLKNFKELRANAAFDRQFNRDLQEDEADELKSRRATAEKLLSLTPAIAGGKQNENFQRLQNQIVAIDAQLEAIRQQKKTLADTSFNQRFEDFKKNQVDSIEAEKRLEVAAKKRADDFKKAKEKVIELGKLYSETFESLSVRVNSNNPFVSLFSEADKSLKTLRENTRGLSADLISTFEQMESKAQSLKLFEARIDNNLSVFDLRERANDLRNSNQSPLKIDDPNKFFEDYIEFYANKLEADFQKRGGGATQFNLTGAGSGTFGFSQSSEQRGVRYNSNIFTGADGKQYTNGFSQSRENPLMRYNSNIFTNADGKQYTNGFSQSRLTFADLTESEKRAYVEKSSKSEIDLSLNDRLERQRAIIYDGAFSEDQKALADRKFLALTSGIDSKELSGRNRETLALTAERQAERQEKYQREALAVEKEKLIVQKTIAENGRRLIEIAEKDGFKAIENVIRFVDDTTGGVTPELQPAATARDTQKAYDAAYRGGTFYEDSQK